LVGIIRELIFNHVIIILHEDFFAKEEEGCLLHKKRNRHPGKIKKRG